MSEAPSAAPALKVIAAADYDRRQFIGSSNVAAIMGMAPEFADGRRQTAYDVWLAKTGEQREELDPATKLFLERRKRWEPVVVAMLREELDAEITAINLQYVHPTVPYFAAEIDAEAREHGDTINVEIKTVHVHTYGERYGWGEPGTDNVPIHYWLQVQFGLMCTGRQRAVLGALVGIDDLLFYPIERDEGDIAKISEACHGFWTDYVLAKLAPPAQNIRDLNKIFRTAVPDKRITGDSELGAKALRLRAIEGMQDALQMERDALEFEVKNAMRDAQELWVDGHKLIKWPEQKWSRLDQAGLKEAEKDVYRRFLLSGKHRVFSILKSLT